MTAEKTRYCFGETPLGKILASAEAGALTGLWFSGQRYFPPTIERWTEDADAPVFTALREWLLRYFAGENPAPNFPLSPRGTPFQTAVWDILLAIPYGTTTTYGAIAKRLSAHRDKQPASARAVGGAVGHNPISILIPCHRVVGSTGSLTGYAGGLEKKKALLRLEGAVLPV